MTAAWSTAAAFLRAGGTVDDPGTRAVVVRIVRVVHAVKTDQSVPPHDAEPCDDTRSVIRPGDVPRLVLSHPGSSEELVAILAPLTEADVGTFSRIDILRVAVTRARAGAGRLGWWGLIVLTLCVFLWLHQIGTLAAPIVGQHTWRQADTYSVAYNFHHESANFFYPRIDWNHGRTGVMGMETPVVPYLAHLLMFVIGDGPQTFRLTVWLLCMFGAACGGLLLARGGGRGLALGYCAMLAFSPLFLFEMRQIQPDGPSAMLALAAAFFLHRSAGQPGRRDFVWGVALFSVAALIKVPALAITPAMWLFSVYGAAGGWRRWLKRGAAFVVPVGLAGLWYAWGEHLNQTYNGGYAYFATHVELAALWANLRDGTGLKHIFTYLLPGYVTNWCLAPAVLVGLVVSASKRHRRLGLPFLVWLLATASFLVLFSDRLDAHWYYATPALPPVAYFGALGLERAYTAFVAAWRGERPAPWGGLVVLFATLATFLVGGAPGRGGAVTGANVGVTWIAATGAGALVVCALLAAGLASGRLRLPRIVCVVVLGLGVASTGLRATHDGREALLHRVGMETWRRFDSRWGGLRETLDRHSTREDLIVADIANPKALHWAMRKGWAEGTAKHKERGLDYYRKRHARFYLHLASAPLLPELRSAKPLASTDDWKLFCLDRQACIPRGADASAGAVQSTTVANMRFACTSRSASTCAMKWWNADAAVIAARWGGEPRWWSSSAEYGGFFGRPDAQSVRLAGLGR